jgi:cytochrome c oxidase cbb3-type subunit 1
LVVLLVSAAKWLVVASVFGLIASIKFHSPEFLANVPWLTYGRVRPAWLDAVLYGFCMQAGLGVSLWLLARLGRVVLQQPGLVLFGAIFWNLGVLAGVIGILAGDSTGFENLEMPIYATPFLLIGYLLIGAWGVITFHRRRPGPLFVSHWFLLAALFWFPWIYTTAQLLLVLFPVRGVAQAVIAWWYSANFLTVWLGLVGTGTIFFFVPQLTGRDLHSRYLALFAFWGLLLFGPWTGIPNTAPVPAWMPSISTVTTILMLVPLVVIALNLHGTLADQYSLLWRNPSLRFIGFGAGALVASLALNALAALGPVSVVTNFTWFTFARGYLGFYGFFAMVMFGGIYHILPRVLGVSFAHTKWIGAHFWLAAMGVILVTVPLALGGFLQGLNFLDANIPFLAVVKSTVPFLRWSTIGDLLIAVGHVLLVLNLAGLVVAVYRTRALAAYATATEDLFSPPQPKPAEAKS